jgi:hypothetical protein
MVKRFTDRRVFAPSEGDPGAACGAPITQLGVPGPADPDRWLAMVRRCRTFRRKTGGTRPAEVRAGGYVTVMGEIAFPDGGVVLDLDVAWIHGSEAAKYNTDPDIQVHACDEHTYILRQNMAVSYEAPFMFLLFGASRAVLLDTGATANPEFFPLRRTVDSIMDGWLAGHPHPDDYGLLVLHTHSHTDHTAADGQFADRPGTVVIGAKRDVAWPYFGFSDQPDSVAEVDLGGRVLDCLATPGHHQAAVTYYDR